MLPIVVSVLVSRVRTTILITKAGMANKEPRQKNPINHPFRPGLPDIFTKKIVEPEYASMIKYVFFYLQFFKKVKLKIRVVKK
jgi:hypothetical protein